MEVIFIRHTSVDVPPGVCYGQTDVPLRHSFEQEVRYPVVYVLLPTADILMPNVTPELWK